MAQLSHISCKIDSSDMKRKIKLISSSVKIVRRFHIRKDKVDEICLKRVEKGL